MIEVLAPGPLATIQDLGRPGHAAHGVGRSGAADRSALRLANRLVGNDEGAAALELTFGGLRLRFTDAATIALAGAPCRARCGDREVDTQAAVTIGEGDELRVGTPSSGVRTYLAVAGGIDVEPVLGSRATDTLAGLGPPPLRAGDRLPIGATTAVEMTPPARVGATTAVDVAPSASATTGHVVPATFAPEPVLRVLPGPRQDWFADAAMTTLCDAAWTVTPRSDRVGLRLDGPALERRRDAELEPEGMVEGALQVPPDGRPVLFLADHPVTGGYPVIAVVASEDIRLAAQARPGARLRFRPA